MEQNYDHLVGKKVRTTVGGRNDTLIVNGVDPAVGITLSWENNPKRRICLVEPAVHALRQKDPWTDTDELKHTQRHYAKSFRHWVEGIAGGELNDAWKRRDNDIDKEFSYTDSGQPPDMCPFT